MSDTILSKRTSKNVPFGRQEILLLLRAYQIHPCSWAEIISEIIDNKNQLPVSARELYDTATTSQLKSRLSTKLSKLMKEPNDDAEIRTEIKEIKKLESQHVTEKTKEPGDGIAHEDSNPTAGPSCPDTSRKSATNKRDRMVDLLPSDEEIPKKRKKEKKDSLVSIMMKNQKAYNKFITKKVPKLLQVFGIEESSSSDSD